MFPSFEASWVTIWWDIWDFKRPMNNPVPDVALICGPTAFIVRVFWGFWLIPLNISTMPLDTPREWIISMQICQNVVKEWYASS